MRVRVLRSAAAEAEIVAILDYLVEYSPPAAGRFLQAMERAERQLAELPNSGPRGLRPGTRRLIVGDYILSYRRRGEDVEIFAVRHGRRRDARL